MTREHRKSPRIPFSTVVKVTSKEDKWDVSSIDISVGGMYMISDIKPALGTELELEFDTRDVHLEVPAIVRWTNMNGFGVQFGLIGAKETHAINQIDSPSDLL